MREILYCVFTDDEKAFFTETGCKKSVVKVRKVCTVRNCVKQFYNQIKNCSDVSYYFVVHLLQMKLI